MILYVPLVNGPQVAVDDAVAVGEAGPDGFEFGELLQAVTGGAGEVGPPGVRQLGDRAVGKDRLIDTRRQFRPVGGGVVDGVVDDQAHGPVAIQVAEGVPGIDGTIPHLPRRLVLRCEENGRNRLANQARRGDSSGHVRDSTGTPIGRRLTLVYLLKFCARPHGVSRMPRQGRTGVAHRAFGGLICAGMPGGVS